MDTAVLSVWRFTDGRRGHDAQSQGLAQALARLHPCTVHDLPVPARARSLLDLLLRRCTPGTALPDPALLIGAGHGTHLPLLAARRARGGRSIVLMTPSLPARCFDLCLIPEHDAPGDGPNVIHTRGPLNTIRPGGAARPGPGLVLIGGPSRHFHWSHELLLKQLRAVLAQSRQRWLISDSPRTPAATRAALHLLAGQDALYVPWDRAGPGWLLEHLPAAADAWISCDSLAMIYEALTAGCRVGVLDLPPRADARVAHAVLQLVAAAMITPFAAWQAGTALKASPFMLDEATRCAGLVLQRLVAGTAPARGRTA